MLLVLMPVLSPAGDWRGNVALELRRFLEPATSSLQSDQNTSLSGEIEYYHAFDDGINNFVVTPFFRKDENDENRTHADIRELAWIQYADEYELRVGISKVFWGVTESRHLVDIINQTDNVENIDGEEKLGQPMVNLSYLTDDSGTIDFFLLPYFREREYPSLTGRPRLPLPVDTDNPVYESPDEQHHTDLALRWSHSFDVWDIGISYFDGTARQPRLVPDLDGDGLPILVPHYDQIGQAGIDAQATTEAWLWKLESIYVDTKNQANYSAAVGGFEYTFVGIFDGDSDIGLISEYLYDQRADTQPFQDDIMVGLRWVPNDEHSTEVLFGTIQDLDGGGRTYNLEASRRIAESFVLSGELRAISGAANDPVLDSVANDDYLQVELGYYF
jgi:hypothetical protein